MFWFTYEGSDSKFPSTKHWMHVDFPFGNCSSETYPQHLQMKRTALVNLKKLLWHLFPGPGISQMLLFPLPWSQHHSAMIPDVWQSQLPQWAKAVAESEILLDWLVILIRKLTPACERAELKERKVWRSSPGMFTGDLFS